jgi:hypothetical protein
MKRRQTPLRERSTNPDRRRRAREKKRRQMGDDTGLAAFIRSKPCAACGGRPSIVAHIRTRGAGHGVRDRDGWPNVLPLCQTCHGLQHVIGWDRFEVRAGISAADVAALIVKEWESEQ